MMMTAMRIAIGDDDKSNGDGGGSYYGDHKYDEDDDGNCGDGDIDECSTTGKPTRSFATERVSLDSV
jgi:hypothetical protein